MKIVGLCGTSGSGKGVASRFFESLGCFVVDTDKLYHGMITGDSECSRDIIACFGETIKNEKGGINRERLGEIVFSDKNNLQMLNSVAHKHVRLALHEIAEKKRNEGTDVLIYDAPLLFEANMQHECDFTVAVTADKETRIKRIMKRDCITSEKANKRISSQHTDEFFSENCDFVIENNRDTAHLLIGVKNVLDKIKGMD